MSAEKRRSSVDEKEEPDENDGWIGPMPSEASKPKPKKRKGIVTSLQFLTTGTYIKVYGS